MTNPEFNPERDPLAAQQHMTPEQLAELNQLRQVEAHDSMAEAAANYDALMGRMVSPEPVATSEQRDFSVQAGASNKILGAEAENLPKDDIEKTHLAFELDEVAGDQVGQRERLNRVATSMHRVTENVLHDFGIDHPQVGNEGASNFAAEKALLAEDVRKMHRGGDAEELSPLRSEELNRVLNQEVGQETIREIARDPTKAAEMYDEDPEVARLAATAAANLKQNGTVNYRTSQRLGAAMRAGDPGQVETLAEAA